MNYYCSDVQVRGAYPYFAERLWNKNKVKLEILPEGEQILREGTVDFYSHSYYMSLCASTDLAKDIYVDKHDDGTGTLARIRKQSFT